MRNATVSQRKPHDPMKPVLSKLAAVFPLVCFIVLSPEAYAAGGLDCGEKTFSLNVYEQVSNYSLALGFALFFFATLLDKKKVKIWLFVFSVLPFIPWVYVHFFVDFDQIKKTVFNYDLLVENTLANIAEGQERYKSEHSTYLKDLEQLHSHIAGSHGIDPCVRILVIQTYHDHWTGVARHVSSPNKISWDSRSGSSLKKG